MSLPRVRFSFQLPAVPVFYPDRMCAAHTCVSVSTWVLGSITLGLGGSPTFQASCSKPPTFTSAPLRPSSSSPCWHAPSSAARTARQGMHLAGHGILAAIRSISAPLCAPWLVILGGQRAFRPSLHFQPPWGPLLARRLFCHHSQGFGAAQVGQPQRAALT